MRKMIIALSAATLVVPVLPASTAFAHESGSYRGQTFRETQGQTYCRKSNGTTGLLVGGAAGVLAGRAIDKRGSRMTGSVLGAAAGALLGRHVQRNVISRRCR